MEKYKELRDFAERIKAKGIPEQQYIAEGIFGLLAERKSENESNTSSVSQGLTPSSPGAQPARHRRSESSEERSRREPVREGFIGGAIGSEKGVDISKYSYFVEFGCGDYVCAFG